MSHDLAATTVHHEWRSSPEETFTRHAVTVVLVAAFTFSFSFTNVWAPGLPLGVPGSAAPLAGPCGGSASIVGLLAARYLSLHSVESRQLRTVRLLRAIRR
ncbi:MAG: hypothetical protein JWN00_5982 [Actinomycetia bacterium]|nr:hypothetical protein [Actinomycetes bacterium]